MKKPKIDWVEATKAIQYAFDQGAVTAQTRANLMDFIEENVLEEAKEADEFLFKKKTKP